MKKIVIPVVAFLLLFIVAFGVVLSGMVRRQTYFRHAKYHYAYSQQAGECTAVGADGTQVVCSNHNTRHFINAVTRTEIKALVFPPRTNGLDTVTLTFLNGAEYTVYDAGEKNGEDIVYIKYSYDGKTEYFSITGYNTFERVSVCVSPEGYNSPNEPA